jgi:hypothetical protein
MANAGNNVYTPLFEKTLEEFKKTLKKKDKENFKISTFADLEMSIGDLQAKQHSQRRQQALIRIKPFLEAMEQFGKIIEVFCNTSEFVAFIWVSKWYTGRYSSISHLSYLRTTAHTDTGASQVFTPGMSRISIVTWLLQKMRADVR